MATNDYISDDQQQTYHSGDPLRDFFRWIQRMIRTILPTSTEVPDNVMALEIEAFDRNNPHWDYDQRYDAALRAYKSGTPVEAAESLYDVSLSNVTEIVQPEKRE